MAEENAGEIISWRRHLHRHPELSFKEFETSKFIAAKLASWDIPHRTVGGTGVLGIIRGDGDSGKVIALRADIDALPIREANSAEYVSQDPGVMHACGHDAHTSCLLGAAQILQQMRHAFSGTVKLIFQPAEEKLPGGASILIRENVLEDPRVQHIIGQHVFNRLPVGKAGFCFGPMMAASDEIYMRIIGKGGHGAYPHLTIDPVMMSAQILVSLQQLVSRRRPPFEPMVLSFGKVMANGATNVIPDSVEIEGTLRTMNEPLRDTMHAEITRIAQKTAEAFGGKAEIDIVRGYPVLHNDKTFTQTAFERAAAYLGAENVVEIEPQMGAEDFAFYSQELPACFYRLGTGNPGKGIDAPLHTPHFDIDESALSIGAGLMAWQAIAELQR